MKIDGARLIEDALSALFARLYAYRRPGGRVTLTIGDSRVSFNPDFGKEIEMATTFTAGETKAFKLTVIDAFGNPAKIDGAPAWNIEDPTGLFTLAVNADDPTQGTLTSTGAVGGPVQFKADFDADLGEGVKI